MILEFLSSLKEGYRRRTTTKKKEKEKENYTDNYYMGFLFLVYFVLFSSKVLLPTYKVCLNKRNYTTNNAFSKIVPRAHGEVTAYDY